MAEPLDEPRGVVARNELANDPPRLSESREAMEIEALPLQRAHEALDHAVALRLPNVRRRDRQAQPLHLARRPWRSGRRRGARPAGPARALPSHRRTSPDA